MREKSTIFRWASPGMNRRKGIAKETYGQYLKLVANLTDRDDVDQLRWQATAVSIILSCDILVGTDLATFFAIEDYTTAPEGFQKTHYWQYRMAYRTVSSCMSLTETSAYAKNPPESTEVFSSLTMRLHIAYLQR